MPNRILKESICTSENIDQLSAFQETFFYRLIVNCDDYGRMDARPKILASRLFPLKDLRAAQIEDALRALTSAELVILYEVDGKPFLQMKTWDRHQQVRAKHSKYPSLEEATKTSENICNQMISDDNKCPRNPIQYESNPNTNTKTEIARAKEEMFARFWAAYPRHEAKTKAKASFDKIHPDETLLQTMLIAINRWKDSAQWKEAGGQFIPHPATWLNQRRWEDEPPKPSTGKPVQAREYEQRSYEGQDSMDDVLNRLSGRAG